MYFEYQTEPQQGANWVPTVDVCEREDRIVIFVEMPGVDRSDIQLAWNEGVLIISGLKRQMPPDYGAAKYLCLERTYGRFRREIAINLPVNHKQATAELKNGLMKIYLPKSRPETTTIPIL
jgi:HSP20 family protein